MSDIHIMDLDTLQTEVNCVFHIVIPGADNLAGIPWCDVIKEYYKPVPVLPDNDVENALISDGKVVEIVEVMEFSSTDLSNAEREAEVEKYYTDLKDKRLTRLQKQLNFYGKEIDI